MWLQNDHEKNIYTVRAQCEGPNTQKEGERVGGGGHKPPGYYSKTYHVLPVQETTYVKVQPAAQPREKPLKMQPVSNCQGTSKTATRQ